jgi:hypothetical protein
MFTQAERDSEMRKVAAFATAFMHGIAGTAGGLRITITEPDLPVREIADRPRTLTAAWYRPEVRPGEAGEIVAVAIRFIGLARVMNDEAIGKFDEACGDLRPCAAIAKMIDLDVSKSASRDDAELE